MLRVSGCFEWVLVERPVGHSSAVPLSSLHLGRPKWLTRRPYWRSATGAVGLSREFAGRQGAPILVGLD